MPHNWVQESQKNRLCESEGRNDIIVEPRDVVLLHQDVFKKPVYLHFLTPHHIFLY
jgi:hypothetical protein